MTPLDVLVVGVGRMGGHHLRKLRLRSDVRAHAHDPEEGVRSSLRTPDLAIIAVPTHLHLQVALPLLERGVPCLVEKPLAPTPSQARRLAAHPHCLPGHSERFNPAFRAVEPHVAGHARFVQAERLAPPPGRSLDVDVILDLMIHDLDLACHLAGESPERVHAVGVAIRTPRNAPGPDVGPGQGTAGPHARVDIANARLETASGSVATLTASRVSRRADRTLRIFTPDDYWSLDLVGGRAVRVPWGQGRLDAEDVSLPPGDALDAEHASALAFVRGVSPFPIPPAEAVRAVQTACTVTEAIRTHARLFEDSRPAGES